jgi:hypothetical protein
MNEMLPRVKKLGANNGWLKFPGGSSTGRLQSDSKRLGDGEAAGVEVLRDVNHFRMRAEKLSILGVVLRPPIVRKK